jgi:N-acetylated-alpha-linked acidic dipeptidase
MLMFGLILFLRFKKEATKFRLEKVKAVDEKDDIRLRALNDRMVNVEKCFITAAGLPNRAITKHVVFAPSINNSYGSTRFPGIADLVAKDNKTDQDWLDIRQQTSIVFNAISEATQTLKSDAY